MGGLVLWRKGEALGLAGVLLLAAYAGLIALEHFSMLQPRQSVDVRLTQELANAEFVDDPPPGAGEWPQWRGAGRDGVAHEPQLLTQWPKNGPKRLWQVDLGEGYSSIAVAAGRAYTLLRQGEDEIVVCWRAGDGKELWRHKYRVATNYGYPGPRATPTIEGNRVYTLGAAGMLLCLDGEKGTVLWSHDLARELRASGGQWGQAFSPLVEGDLLITAPGAHGASLAAFHKGSGKLAWTSLDDPAGYSSPVAFTASGVRQIVAFMGDAVVGVSPADGRQYWRFEWLTQFEVNAATPVVFHTRQGGRLNDYVFISSGYGKGCALLRIEKTAAGNFAARPVFQNNYLCSHFGTPVRYHDHLYGFNESTLVCMDLRTGEIRWSKQGFHKGSLLRVDQYLIVLGEMGQLALMEASPEEPKPMAEGRFFPSSRCWTMPVLAEGKLFLRDEKQAACLDLRGR